MEIVYIWKASSVFDPPPINQSINHSISLPLHVSQNNQPIRNLISSSFGLRVLQLSSSLSTSLRICDKHNLPLSAWRLVYPHATNSRKKNLTSLSVLWGNIRWDRFCARVAFICCCLVSESCLSVRHVPGMTGITSFPSAICASESKVMSVLEEVAFSNVLLPTCG